MQTIAQCNRQPLHTICILLAGGLLLLPWFGTAVAQILGFSDRL